jgi:hypothetical protein
MALGKSSSSTTERAAFAKKKPRLKNESPWFIEEECRKYQEN